jgi:hypothetical protein
MAQITDASAVSGGLKVDPTSKGASAELVNADGTRMGVTHGAAFTAEQRAVPMAVRNDDNLRIARGDRLGNTSVALNNVLFSEYFEGTTLSASRLSNANTTYAVAQTLSGLTLNSGASAAANGVSVVKTLRQFPKLQRAPLQFKARARLGHQTNAVAEIGFGDPTGTTAIATGAYWQVTNGGVVQPVLTFGGVDVTGTAVTMPSGWQSNLYTWDVILDDDEATYFVQDTETGLIIAERRIQLPRAQQRLWSATHLPAFCRLYATAVAPPAAPVMVVAHIDVVMFDAFMNKPWGHTAAHNGQGSAINPTAFTQSANWANSAVLASATLSNTAAGYTTLGGLFQFAAVAGAVTDYALFGYTVPAPYSLVVTGIDIDTWNTGTAVATTPHLLVWGCGADQAAVTLAGAANVRTPLGAQSFAVAAPAGATAARISADFSQAPLVTNAGRFFTIILRMPVATATATQVLQGMVNVKGYFE